MTYWWSFRTFFFSKWLIRQYIFNLGLEISNSTPFSCLGKLKMQRHEYLCCFKPHHILIILTGHGDKTRELQTRHFEPSKMLERRRHWQDGVYHPNTLACWHLHVILLLPLILNLLLRLLWICPKRAAPDSEVLVTLRCYTSNMLLSTHIGGGEIAQSLASLSTKRAARVRSPLNPLVSERWNSITVLLTRSHKCQRLVQKRPSMCYYVCVIMHVKDP